MEEKLLTTPAIKSQAIGSEIRVIDHDHDFVEEEIDVRTKCGDLFQGAPVLVLCAKIFDLGGKLSSFAMQRRLPQAQREEST